MLRNSIKQKQIFFLMIGCLWWRSMLWVAMPAYGKGPSSRPVVPLVSQPSFSPQVLTPSPPSVLAIAKPRETGAVDIPLTLLFTSDLGGWLRNFSCPKKTETLANSSIDVANMLWQINKVRRELLARKVPRHFLFNTGDNLSPRQETRFLLQFEGIEGLNFVAFVFRMLHYDLIGLGNHEFSVPPDRLRLFLQLARRFGLSFAASNMTRIAKHHELSGLINVDSETQQHRPYFLMTTRPYHGRVLRLAVFHLIPQNMPVDAKRLQGLTIEDPYSYARNVVKKIREHKPPIDVVVALSHLETSSTKGENVIRLAKEVEGIDMILTNELHERDPHLRGLVYVNPEGKRVHIVGGVPREKMIGRVDVNIRTIPQKPSTVLSVNVRGIPLQQNAFAYELRRELMIWEKTYCKSWGKPLGRGVIHSDHSLRHDNFFSYVLNLMRHHVKAEIAVINEGAIRGTPFPIRHYITQDELYRAMLFDSKLVYLTATGETLQQWLGSLSEQKEKLASTGWAGGQVNGRSLAAKKTYSVVTIDYVLQLWRNRIVQSIEQQKSMEQSTQQQIAMFQQQRQQLEKAVEGIRRGRTQYPAALLAEVEQLQKNALQRQMRTNPPLSPADQQWIMQQYQKMGALQQQIYSAEIFYEKKIEELKIQIKKQQERIDEARKKGESVTYNMRDLQYKQQDYEQKIKELKRTQKNNKMQEAQYDNFMKNWPQTIGTMERVKVTTRQEKARLQQELQAFDRKWRVVTYRGCPAVALSDQCSERCCPKLRTLVFRHFLQNEFQQMAPIRPPAPYTLPGQTKIEPKPFGPNEIPYSGNLVSLEERFAWDLDINFSFRVDINYVTPDNLIGPFSYFRVTSEFFRQFQIAGDFKLQLNAGTLHHQWTSVAQIQYGAYIRSQYDQSQTPPVVDDIFDEANDRIQVSTQYQFRRWQWFKPLIRIEIDTEITRNRRPNLSDEKFLEKLSQYRYRHLSLEAEVGFELTALDGVLSFKIGFSYKREFAPELFPALGTSDALKYPNLGGFPDTNDQVGMSVSYQTGLIRLFSIGRQASTFQSRGKYSLYLSIPPSFLVDQGILLVHDIELQNTLAIGLTDNVSLSLELKTIIYRGTLQKPTSFGNANPFLRSQGPWAFWLTPTIALSVQWGTRGQQP